MIRSTALHKGLTAFVLCGLLSSLTGCAIERTYIVDPAVAEQLMQGSPQQTARTFPALRQTDRRPVTVQAKSVVPGSAQTVGGVTVVKTKKQGKMLNAGIVLTLFGSAISVVGAGLFWGTSGTSRTVGAVLAGSGEPFMISGSVLWVLGLKRNPQEGAP